MVSETARLLDLLQIHKGSNRSYRAERRRIAEAEGDVESRWLDLIDQVLWQLDPVQWEELDGEDAEAAYASAEPCREDMRVAVTAAELPTAGTYRIAGNDCPTEAQREQLEEPRHRFLGEMYDLYIEAKIAAEHLEPTWAPVVDAFTVWVEAASEFDLNEISTAWPKVLRGWREALNATTREAAEALRTSPSTIVRYEQGKRIAARDRVEAMVPRICAYGPAVPFTKDRRALEEAAEMFGMDHSGGAPDAMGLEQAALRSSQLRDELLEDLQDRLDTLNDAQLAAVYALITDPGRIDDLQNWASTDPLGGVRQLLTAVAREQR